MHRPTARQITGIEADAETETDRQKMGQTDIQTKIQRLKRRRHGREDRKTDRQIDSETSILREASELRGRQATLEPTDKQTNKIQKSR